uniref:Uncharacterized protein n=1 Tax=Aegilops tauschii subsp. strangulata TaxID=200361 RepID=A0A453BUF6_AEGTS
MVLSLKKLQGILNMEQSMDNDCFNIVVHILACDEGSMMLDSTRDQKFCDKETIQKLATLFDSWLGIDNNISSSNMVSKVFCLLFIMVYVVCNSYHL